MKDNTVEDIQKIFEEAPAARKALLDNHSNLNKVADYCENNYLNVEDTGKVVEESKALTTQALASVAYQINTLASSVLRLLEAQTVQLKQMESSVNLLTMTVDMYKEKVARQEIGLLTKPCKIVYTQKMVPPTTLEEPIYGYERVPISYSSLDSLGHRSWDGTNAVQKKPSETDTLTPQPNTQEGGYLHGSSSGIAVPPPSVPNWAGFRSTVPQTCTTPQPPSSAKEIPLSEPLGFSSETPIITDIGALPPPPTPLCNSMTAPPPSPPPPPSSLGFRNSFLPSPPALQSDFMDPLPPPPPPEHFEGLLLLPPPSSPCPHTSAGRVHVPPPAPPPLSNIATGAPPINCSSLLPPPPPQNTSMIPQPPPPPPPPSGKDKFSIPPPPPPPPF